MAFLIHSVDDGHVLPWEYLPAEDLIPQVGMALKMESGNLVVASGADRPQYVAMCTMEDFVPAGGRIPVVRVTSDVVWESFLTASGNSLNVGDSVNISGDGMGVNNTVGGSAQIVEMLARSTGSTVRVRFQ
ncbi:MAG: hypothetical protein E7458_03925 [Ruminococcaceae bacterium]|nr:hypothetical protein [Oscillospiraceae bacterium]